MSSAASELLGFPVRDRLKVPNRYAEAGQRLFADVTGVLRSRFGRAVFPRVLDAMEARSAVILRQLATDPRLSIVNRSLVPSLLRIVRIAAHYRVPVTVVLALVSPDRARLNAEKVGASLVERLVVPESATAAERLDFAERALSEDCVPILPRVVPAAAAGLAMLGAAGSLLGKDAGAGDLQMVLRGLPHNITTKMDLALWDLAGRIREDRDAAVLLRDGSTDDLTGRFRAGNLPSVAQRGLGEFLSRYGHRAVAEIDLGIPRWSDDPRHILGVLANYLRLEDGMTAPDAVFARRPPTD